MPTEAQTPALLAAHETNVSHQGAVVKAGSFPRAYQVPYLLCWPRAAAYPSSCRATSSSFSALLEMGVLLTGHG